MRTLPDTQLSRYFTRYNLIEGTAMPQQARLLNWQHIDQYLANEQKFMALCRRLDQVIIDLNAHFQSQLQAQSLITLAVSSGFRCLAWELLQKRSGNSQHCIGAAIDVYPVTNAFNLNLVEVVSHLRVKYWKSWQGGFAVKDPTFDKHGKLLSLGFLHFDNRPHPARWKY